MICVMIITSESTENLLRRTKTTTVTISGILMCMLLRMQYWKKTSVFDGPFTSFKDILKQKVDISNTNLSA